MRKPRPGHALWRRFTPSAVWRQHLALSLRRQLEASPRAFEAAYRLVGAHPAGLVNRQSDLLIEGYPRSANTFTLYAFCAAQPSMPRVAGHLHSPGNVRLAAKLGKPICLLLRAPRAAVRSLLVRNPTENPALLLRAYATFYESLWTLRHALVVGRFEAVTTDFGSVIQRINQRFQTTFVPFEHTPPAMHLVRLQLEARNGQRGIRYGYLPDPRREQLKAHASLSSHPRLLARCERIYETWCGECSSSYIPNHKSG